LVLVVIARSPNPESRLPRNYRLAGLIERQQREAAALRIEVDGLRTRVQDLTTAGADRLNDAALRKAALDNALLEAGLVPMRGAGVKVTLDDSLLDKAPSGDVNDLVIHSQNVQA